MVQFYRRQKSLLKQYIYSPVATPISYVVNHVVVKSILFLNGLAVTWMCRANLAWLPGRKPWGFFYLHKSKMGAMSVARA